MNEAVNQVVSPQDTTAANPLTSVAPIVQANTNVTDSSAINEPFKKLPKLTKKQKVFVREYKKPKVSGVQAAMKAYDTKDYMTAAQISSENLKKPQIISHLEEYGSVVEDVLKSSIERYRDSDDLNEVKEANLNARWIHDKVYGKATQRTENVNLNVNISDIISGLL